MTLNGNTADLAKIKSSLPKDAPKTNYFLIEFSQPLLQKEHDRLKELQVSLEEFVGKNTYLCVSEATDPSKLEKEAFVKLATAYTAGQKVFPEVQDLVKSSSGNTANRTCSLALAGLFILS